MVHSQIRRQTKKKSFLACYTFHINIYFCKGSKLSLYGCFTIATINNFNTTVHINKTLFCFIPHADLLSITQ